jgi:hypothetical protein
VIHRQSSTAATVTSTRTSEIEHEERKVQGMRRTIPKRPSRATIVVLLANVQQLAENSIVLRHFRAERGGSSRAGIGGGGGGVVARNSSRRRLARNATGSAAPAD